MESLVAGRNLRAVKPQKARSLSEEKLSSTCPPSLSPNTASTTESPLARTAGDMSLEWGGTFSYTPTSHTRKLPTIPQNTLDATIMESNPMEA